MPCAHLAIIAALLGSAAANVAADESAYRVDVDQAVATLRALCDTRPGPWRFHWPAVEGGEAENLDDSGWAEVWPEHRWNKPNSAAWYRLTVKVPERIGLAPVPGGPLVLEVGVDDDGEIYVNGRLVHRFHWDGGKVTLTDDARPGQRFVVAVKVINGPVHGRLRWARLRYTRLDGARQAMAATAYRLEFARDLCRVDDKAGTRALEAVRAAVSAIDWPSVASDPDRFARSLEASANELQPLSRLAKKYTLYLVGHAHIDMNWLWLWPETIRVCRDTWTQVIRFMDEFPQFRFSESQPAAYRAIEQHHPDLFRAIQRRAMEGRWEIVGATWVQGDTNMASGEALCRQLLTAREYFMDKFGRWTRTAWLPDNFGHAWTVPTIFSDAGIRWYYFARCRPGVPLFWWQGPDGSRLLAYSYGGYAWRIDRGVCRIPLEVKSKVRVCSAMIAYGVGDHGGGPTRRDIETAIALQREPIAPTIKFAAADDFFSAALAEKSDLPVVRRELNFTFRGCYTTHADMKRRNRHLENLLPTAEAAAAAAHILCGKPYPREEFMEAWRCVCFNQFHDLLPGTAIHDSYKFCHQLYDKAEDAAARWLRDSLSAIAAAVDTRGQGQPVVVWNRLGWTRPGWVTVEIPLRGADALQAIGPDGRRIPAYVLRRTSDGRAQVRMLVTAPACGWSTWHIRPAAEPAPVPVKAKEEPHAITLESDTVRAVIDRATGALSSLYDKTADRDLVPSGEQLGLLQILWESPNDMSAWNIGRIKWTRALDKAESVSLGREGQDGPPVVRVVHRWGKSRFVQRITLAAHRPQVDFALEADWQELGNQRHGGPMLKVAFPLRLRRPLFTCEIPFGWIERTPDGQDVPAQRWADLSETRLKRGLGRAVTVDLSPYFNQDVFATADQPSDGDFDGLGVAYPVEIFARAKDGILRFRGLPCRVPPLEPGAKNAVACRGQQIPLPPAHAGSVLLLGAAAPASHSALGALIFADHSREAVEIGFSDWCYGPRPDEYIVARCPYRYDRRGRASPEVRIFARFYDVPEGKRLRAIALPDAARIRIFAITLVPRVERVANYGVCLLNDCKYGHDAQSSTLRLTLLRCSFHPDPEPDRGLHRIRYSLLLHSGDWRNAAAPAAALEMNNPLVATVTNTHEGRLPPEGSLIQVHDSVVLGKANPTPPAAVLSAVKMADHRRGVIVRCWDAAGIERKIRIRAGFRVARAEVTNVVEAATRAKLRVRGGHTVEAPLPARGILTVRLVPAASRK